MDELQRVLAYPQFELDVAEQLTAFERYRTLVQLVDVPATAVPLPQCPDRDDQKFLELAWHSQARWLITKDKALLRMRRALKTAAGLVVVTPGGFDTCAAC